jgi:GTP cyclohydrolase I
MIEISKKIIERLKSKNLPFHSNSNISEVLEEGDRELLIKEVTHKFDAVLRALVIDVDNDPNAKGTAKRLAKMYINEIMGGRYEEEPEAVFFPNKHTGKETGFTGMLVVRTEIKSLCSHHHQPVTGIAYIGILPSENVIGLSKYSRIAHHLARRGTLQEELAEDIANKIIEKTGTQNVAVYIEAQHGCVTNRGIEAHDSTTQTTVLRGHFMSDGVVRKEFYDNIQFQTIRHPQ